ncbi:hypothetical protein ACFL6O_02530 [candidate division KSB1 bacterium]
MRKIRAGILGITSQTGQFLIKLLESHQFISLTELADSDRFSGKKLRDLDIWNISDSVPPYVRSLTIAGLSPNLQCDLVFSCLETQGGEIENQFADYNYPVIMYSNVPASDSLIPIIVPEVNKNHSRLIKVQKTEKFRKRGFIINSADIITYCISILAKPFIDRYRLKGINISGAEYTEKDPLNNQDQEEIKGRLKKVLGEFKTIEISPSDIEIKFDESAGKLPGKKNLLLTFELSKSITDLKPESLFNILNSVSLNSAEYSVPENIINFPREGLKEYLTQDNYFSLLSFDLITERTLQLEIDLKNRNLTSAAAMINLAEFLYNERFI